MSAKQSITFKTATGPLRVSYRKLLKMIDVELASRSLEKTPYFIVKNVTNLSKSSKEDRLLTKHVRKYYFESQLNIKTDGLKSPAYLSTFDDYYKFNNALVKTENSYMIKVDNVYSTLPKCNTNLLRADTIFPSLFHLLSKGKYGFVKVLTVK
jgi:hypothetical protein